MQRSAADEAELVQVGPAVALLNLEACLQGEATCDGKSLSAEHRSQVDHAGRVRNFTA